MSEPELRMLPTSRPDLDDLVPYGAPQLDVAVRLNVNESPYPPPPAVMEDMARRIGGLALNRYPDRDFRAVREALARHAGTLTERIWVANGSNEIIQQLTLAFGGAERRAMTFEPTYEMHTLITRASGTRLIRARRAPDYTMDIGASVEAIRRTQPDIIFLCSPNNPTGTPIPDEGVAAICAASHGLVILDEAYAEFGHGSVLNRQGNLLDEFENLVSTRTFSKAFRMAGARIGYMVAPPAVIEAVMKVRLPYHLSSLTQVAALTALDHAAELEATVETIRHERERLWAELSTTRGITAYPSAANFILFRCDVVPGRKVWNRLKDKGVLVRDFSDTVGCESCLRVSVGTAEQDERFLEALSQALRDE
ncbi:MAG TPA: histidinol-phosphate transaminase [Actinomycetota bacterium]|nr:histidinol-phosphate transaminase [Actinomycetota bacterium]